MSSRPGAPPRGPQLSLADQAFANQEEKSLNKMWEKLNADRIEPKFRAPPPAPPTTHAETWANLDLVSDDADENALEFRGKPYIQLW